MKKIFSNISNYLIDFGKINTIKKKRKIILFGAGVVAKKFLKKYDSNQVSFLLDNNKNLVNTTKFGKKIEDIKKIKEKKFKNKYLIIICTTSYKEVFNQLVNHNLKFNIDFIVCPLLNDLLNISEIEDVNCQILISSGLAAEKKSLSGGGLYLCSIKNSSVSHIKKIYSGPVHGVLVQDNKIYFSDSTKALVVLNKKDLSIIKKIRFKQNTRIHGIAINNKNKSFYLANTLQDKIIEINQEGKILDEIFLSDKFKQHGSAFHHCNDILFDGSSLYVSMFSFSGNHQKNIYDGGVLEIDVYSKKVLGKVFSDLWMPHSPKMIDGNFCVLDSLRGNLYVGDKEITGTFPGFSRGLDHNGKYFFIGQSKNRNYSKVYGTSNNISLDNSVIMFDPNTKISKSLFLNNISEIHSVNVL